MGWLSGRLRKGQDAPESSRAQRFPGRFDDALDVNPAQARRGGRTRRRPPDEAGLTLIEMAIAFATGTPAVTPAIIGPRTSSTWTPSWPPPMSSCPWTCWTGSTRWPGGVTLTPDGIMAL